MKFTPTTIPEVVVVEPDVFGDERGFFLESWQKKKFAEAGITEEFVQDNHSRSVRGTLRGLHYQVRQAQGKLVRVTVGEVFDVAVDIRRGSPTFGRWVGETLSADNFRMLWVPPGFAHGFYVTSDIAEFQYKCTDYYAPEFERSILWNDAEIGVAWPVLPGQQPLLSGKDQAGLPLSETELPA
ncbi:dTDP-4-dehydrorhamnose 3,5-epimerase [Lentisalinibacter sediminis]|uniref:dTDP-4-dehydrorhamnose 3,5-epimerase n=1 Tax=Lentisalinibacter sediminis TaxID=2992237 RepID=UPI0038693578